MVNECNVIRDLLPLYAEKIASSDTRIFVEEHLERCEECRKELEKIVSDGVGDIIENAEELEKEALPLRKMKRKLNVKRLAAVTVSVVMTAAALVGGFAMLTQPELINLSDERIDVKKVCIFEPYDYEETGMKRVCVIYATDYAGHTTGRLKTVWDENRDSPTLVFNMKRAILNLAPPSDSLRYDVFFAPAQAPDTTVWDGEADDFRQVDYAAIRVGDRVVGTKDSVMTDEVPDYIKILYNYFTHPEFFNGVTYTDEWIEFRYSFDGRTERYDYDGNLLKVSRK